jgi:glycosyltransferase involved in cell wall biosynthesis
MSGEKFSKKPILVITESINVDDSSGSKANVALVQNLAALDYNIIVLHYTRQDIELPGITCIAISEIKFSFFYVLSRTHRMLQRILKVNFSHWLENRFGFSFTFFNDSNSIAKAVRKHYSGEDLIITLSKGASFRPHHAMLQMPHLHGKWLAYVHDPYPFHCYPPPYHWTEPGHQQKETFFRKVSEKTRYAGFPSLKLKEWMQEFFPAFAEKSVIIPHQIPNKIDNLKGALPNYFDTNKFTVLHAGNLMKQRDPFPLLKAWQKFLNENPQAEKESQLLLIGPASYHQPRLFNKITNIPSVYISEGYMSYNTVKEMERSASVNIILEAVAKVSPFLPGKFPHLVAVNKPILHIGPKNSETLRLLGKNYPWQAAANDIGTITEKLQQLYILWGEDKHSLKQDRPDLEAYLSASHLTKSIDSLMGDYENF